MKKDAKIRNEARSPFFTFHSSLFICIAALLMQSCDVKDPIYETDHPDKAKITVTADWSGIGQGLTKPTGYKVAYGSEILTAMADKYTFANLLAPGSYTVYFYNEVAAIPVTDKTATVKTVAVGSLEPMPDWLFTGKLTATVAQDKHHEFTVQMAQQVRQLTLIIEPTGGTADKITGITASLSGVAGSLDIDSDTHGMPSNATMSFTKIETGENAGKWTATVRLLGVTGSEQKLSGVIKFTDGIPGDMPLDGDLSAALATFNENKREPLTLGGQSAETPSPTGFTATIKDWEKVTGSGIAN